MSLEKKLINWYTDNKRDLPWRGNRDPYKIWISEIILQQTRVNQGKKYYNRFIKKFPSIKQLASSSESDILNVWKGLGYYNRALNIHSASKNVMNNLNGKFPTTYNEIIKLKGIGDYTASAISSICFNEFNPVVDGNVLRFFSRYFGLKDPIDSIQTKKKIKKIGKELIDKIENPGDFNQAIMEFGALICTPNPNCEICLFGSKCVALKNNDVKTIPVRSIKKKQKKRFFNYLVLIDKKNKLIVEKRFTKDIWPKLNEFPLIESNQEIKDINSLSEFIVFKDSKRISVKKESYKTFKVKHTLSHQILQITFHKFKVNNNFDSGVDIKELDGFNFPVPINNFINNILI